MSSVSADYRQCYHHKRAIIVDKEHQHSLGGDIILTAAESRCNEKLLKAKYKELQDKSYQPWQKNFMHVRKDIEKSRVFQFIRKLPKGASLHSHLYASASYRYVTNDLLHRKHIYVCNIDGRTKLKFVAGDATNTPPNCELLDDKRKTPEFDDWLDAHLLVSDNPENAWDSLRKIFTFMYDLFSYVGVLEDYIYQVLLEHYTDNVYYVEVRTPFVPMYDLNGTDYTAEDFVETLWNTMKKFQRDHSDFIGMKIIYAPYRATTTNIVRKNLDILKRIAQKYPGFIAGIDFVGFEEEGTLLHYFDELTSFGEDFNFYFHAGETNLHGTHVDFNILDAILLDSKRIGHAYALPKHPEMMTLIKEKNIAIEVCPISNQVLGLVADLRNHPAAYLIARGYPIVICNDDPGNWGAEGLSYDWYLTFMAMTPEYTGLHFLKKLAINSLEYSALNETEKVTAFKIWNAKWNKFIESVIRSDIY
ncbi:hypothetical protein Trydic_g2094 [Trypoxylus dichotomus]